MNNKIFVKSTKSDGFAMHFDKTTKLIWLVTIVILSLALSILAGVFIWSKLQKKPLQIPVNSLQNFRFLREPTQNKNNKKIVYGYLPYWNIKTVTLQPELTHFGYFSLTIDAGGNFISSSDAEIDMGLHRLNSEEFLALGNELIDQDKKVEIVISLFEHDTLASFLASEKAQEKFLQNLDNVFLAYPLSGVNIDFEVTGEIAPSTRNNLTKFMKTTREHLNKKYKNVNLSIAMYASAGKGDQLWDVEAMEPYIDYIVIMAYDFHNRRSQQAGPVAPLFGGKEFWEGDINHYLQEYVKNVPAEKLLLGIPFYGYEWQTTSRDSRSHTFPNTGATATFKRINELLNEKKEEFDVQEHWNEDALSPYISYEEDGLTYVIYYENSRSLSYKLDYVNQLDLGGIAIWALGYEGDSRELWEVIQNKIR